jgi:hypothetical protein
VREKKEGKRVFLTGKYMYFNKKKREIHLMVWFAR